MPIYDYICSNCSTRTEFIHGINAPAPRFCPACGAEDTLRKAFVAPSVHFKGSGWAKKDRSSSSGSRTKAAAASESGSSSSSDGSSSSGSGDSASAGKVDGPSSKDSKGSSTTASSEA